jgi:hypothetical protein
MATPNAAENLPAEPASAPSGAPSAPGGGGDAGGSSEQGSPSPKGSEGAPGTAGPSRGTSAQPAGSPSDAPGADGGEIPGKLADPHVPWRKFREVQTELTNTRRQHQSEVEKIHGQIQALTQQNQELAQIKSDYDILEQLIDENPDLADQLFERAGQLKPRAGASPAAAASEANPEVLKEVRQLRGMIDAERAARAEAVENQRLDQTDRSLQEQLRGLLGQAELDESWLPSVREYVLSVARRIPTLSEEEVPYVFAEWAKPLQERLHKQLSTWRNGKLTDQRMLPPSPNGGHTVSASGARGALDRNTKSILEERLKNALGWRNE